MRYDIGLIEAFLDGFGPLQQLRVVSGEFDAHDVHLVAAAVEPGAEVICSSNRRHLAEGPLAGGIKVMARAGSVSRSC